MLNHKITVFYQPSGAAGATIVLYRPSVITPQGRSPTLIFLTIVRVATSITEMSLDGPLAVNNSFSSGDSATPQGRSPTSKDVTTLPLGRSITTSFFPR